MMGTRHIAINSSLAAVAGSVAHLDMTKGASLVAVAAATSRLPDQLEKWFKIPHRTKGHWAITLLGLSVVASFFAVFFAAQADLQADDCIQVIVGGFIIGYGGHLLADMTTFDGLRIFAPFSRKKRWLLPRGFRPYVPSFGEIALSGLICLVCFAYLGQTHGLI
jgi:membrane-bound metal-dependent hydrolase YbcI (DUF457 family)